jgi:hypothetical protein
VNPKERAMMLNLYRVYKTGKTIYSKLLKPIYEELRKDAFEEEDKITKPKKRKPTNAVDKESKRSHRRKKDPK